MSRAQDCEKFLETVQIPHEHHWYATSEPFLVAMRTKTEQWQKMVQSWSDAMEEIFVSLLLKKRSLSHIFAFVFAFLSPDIAEIKFDDADLGDCENCKKDILEFHQRCTQNRRTNYPEFAHWFLRAFQTWKDQRTFLESFDREALCGFAEQIHGIRNRMTRDVTKAEETELSAKYGLMAETMCELVKCDFFDMLRSKKLDVVQFAFASLQLKIRVKKMAQSGLRFTMGNDLNLKCTLRLPHSNEKDYLTRIQYPESFLPHHTGPFVDCRVTMPHWNPKKPHAAISISVERQIATLLFGLEEEES
jgi:hypothetical protein